MTIIQSHSEVGSKTAPHSAKTAAKSSPEVTAETTSSAKIVVVDASEGWLLGSSELVKAEKVLRALWVIYSWIVEWVNWVVACSRRDFQRARERLYVFVRVYWLVENLTVLSHVFFLTERIFDIWRRVNEIARWIASHIFSEDALRRTTSVALHGSIDFSSLVIP